MATVNPTSAGAGTDAIVHRWAITTAGDTGAPVNMQYYPDKTVHVTGTFGSVTLRGSNKAAPNDATAADWFTLSDPQGNDLTFTAAGGALIAENPLWLSPITTGGSGYEISVSGNK